MCTVCGGIKMSDTLIRDNKDYGSVGEFLKYVVKEGSELSVVSAYFTIFAYYGLHEQLDSIKSMKFLFGEPTFITSDNVDVRNYKIEEKMFEYGLLQDAGKVTAEIAKLHAETEFEKYRIVQDRLYKSDYDLFLEEFENKLEANKHGKEY